jgi:hypothetical protein
MSAILPTRTLQPSAIMTVEHMHVVGISQHWSSSTAGLAAMEKDGTP